MDKKIRLRNIKNKSQPITAVVSLNKIVSVCTLKTRTSVVKRKLQKVHVFSIPSKTNGKIIIMHSWIKLRARKTFDSLTTKSISVAWN